MTNYTRMGSCLLAAKLSEDPFGGIHRAVQTTGSAFDKHLLVRTFSEEFLQAGIGSKIPDITRALPQLGGSRAYGQNYRAEAGKPPHVTCDFVLGRSLAQLIEKAKAEQVPFGVDHALSVVQGVAQAIVQMHAKGLHHGILSPHSVWVSFEGAIHIIDAPYASSLAALASKSVTAQTVLAPYMQGTDAPLQRDFFGVGAMLYELLTFDKLPMGLDLVGGALNRATLKAAQEEAPLPAEIKGFLGRLLQGNNTFNSVESFNQELERVLYDGDYSPTTFSLAFFMHTLFREENDKDAAAMKKEQADNYLGFTAAGENLRSGATRVQHIDTLEAEQEKSKKQVFIVAGVSIAAALLAGVYILGRNRENPELVQMRAQLAELQRKTAEQEQAAADVDSKQKAEEAKQKQLLDQIAAAKDSKDSKAAEEAKKQLEESKRRKEELDRQQRELAEKAKQLKETQNAVAQRVAAPAEPKPAPVQPQPQPQPNIPQPTIPQPQPPPAQPQPTNIPTQTIPTQTVETPVRVLNQIPPIFPARAKQLRWEIGKDHLVRLKVFVDESGHPLQVKIIEGVAGGSSYGFDDAAVEAANGSTFIPATRDGRPVKAWLEMRFSFPKQH